MMNENINGEPGNLVGFCEDDSLLQGTQVCGRVYDSQIAISDLRINQGVELCLVTEGTGVFCVLNQVLECQRGDLYVLNSGVPHGYFSRDTEQPMTVQLLTFPVRDWFDDTWADPESRQFCCGIFPENSPISYAALNSKMYGQVEYILRQILSEVQSRDEHWRDAVHAHLTMLLIIIGRYINLAQHDQPVHSREWVHASAAISYIHENCHDSGLTLEAVANSLFISMSNFTYDLIILGGGPAGYTAATYASRSGLRVLVLERMAAGGQLNLTGQIDNYPGFPQGVDGFTLGQHFQESAHRFGAQSRYAQVTGTSLVDPVKTVFTTDGTFSAKTIIVATGADPRPLGLPEESQFIGKGLHYCAHCDGMFYRNKTVAVIGGGNSAVAEALHLSRIAKKVIVIHRRDSLRADPAEQDALRQAENVEFLWNSQVTGIWGQPRLTGLEITHTETGAITSILCDGAFVSIGRVPSTDIVKDHLTLSREGYIIAGETTETNLPGVYAAGDVRTKALRQIVTATADGAMAAHQAARYLQAQT